jgi:hypothetical protein
MPCAINVAIKNKVSKEPLENIWVRVWMYGGKIAALPTYKVTGEDGKTGFFFFLESGPDVRIGVCPNGKYDWFPPLSDFTIYNILVPPLPLWEMEIEI